LEADEIEQWVHISADHVATGDVTVYDKDFQILASGENMGTAFHSANEWMLAYLINLTGNAQLVSVLRDPVRAGNLLSDGCPIQLAALGDRLAGIGQT
jgi:hypothetical protein